MLQDLSTLIMVEILILGALFLATFSLNVQMQSLWKHPYNLLWVLSTNEVGYITAIEGVKEATWLRGLITKLRISQGVTTVFSNGQSAIHLTKNDAYHSKTKHINIKYHYVRDTIATGGIIVKKVHTLENPADVPTKPPPIAKFQHCLHLVSI